jgi:hypothetical protein
MFELTNEVNFWAVEAPGANVGGGGAGEKFDGKEGVVGLVWPSVGVKVGALKVNALRVGRLGSEASEPSKLGFARRLSKVRNTMQGRVCLEYAPIVRS